MSTPRPQQPEHQVLLVREWDEQTTGSGCCGRLGGDTTELCGAADFSRSRELMEQMGAIYRALHAELSRDVCDLQIVDTRNMTYLYPVLYRAARRRGRSRRAAVAAVARGVRQGAVIVDGETVLAGDLPPVDDVVRVVLEALTAARPS